jgi:hypothetical protein
LAEHVDCVTEIATGRLRPVKRYFL